MTELEKVRLGIVKFLRGKYELDEAAGERCGIPCVQFRQSNQTILTINLYDDSYGIQMILGKAEQKEFEAIRGELPEEITQLYDGEHALHDGKWLFIRVDNLKTLEAVKKLILIMKKPNRKPLPKEGAVYGKCGHRCDLCVHYTGITDGFREMLIEHLNAVYGNGWEMRCTGCDTPDCHCNKEGNELCAPLKCLHEKQKGHCFHCDSYPCEKSTVGYNQLGDKNISADDVTWAILPYVPYQYEK